MESVYEFSDSDSNREFTGFHPSDIESEIDSTSHMGSDNSDIELILIFPIMTMKYS